MSATRSKTKKKRSPRTFASDSLRPGSLRLAAPKPEGEQADAELASAALNASFSSEMIHQLIDRIKTI
jgi:hypothetical protein